MGVLVRCTIPQDPKKSMTCWGLTGNRGNETDKNGRVVGFAFEIEAANRTAERLEIIRYVGKRIWVEYMPVGFSRAAALTSWGRVDAKHSETGAAMTDLSFNRETYAFEQTTIGRIVSLYADKPRGSKSKMPVRDLIDIQVGNSGRTFLTLALPGDEIKQAAIACLKSGDLVLLHHISDDSDLSKYTSGIIDRIQPANESGAESAVTSSVEETPKFIEIQSDQGRRYLSRFYFSGNIVGLRKYRTQGEKTVTYPYEAWFSNGGGFWDQGVIILPNKEFFDFAAGALRKAQILQVSGGELMAAWFSIEPGKWLAQKITMGLEKSE